MSEISGDISNGAGAEAMDVDGVRAGAEEENNDEEDNLRSIPAQNPKECREILAQLLGNNDRTEDTIILYTGNEPLEELINNVLQFPPVDARTKEEIAKLGCVTSVVTTTTSTFSNQPNNQEVMEGSMSQQDKIRDQCNKFINNLTLLEGYGTEPWSKTVNVKAEQFFSSDSSKTAEERERDFQEFLKCSIDSTVDKNDVIPTSPTDPQISINQSTLAASDSSSKLQNKPETSCSANSELNSVSPRVNEEDDEGCHDLDPSYVFADLVHQDDFGTLNGHNGNPDGRENYGFDDRIPDEAITSSYVFDLVLQSLTPNENVTSSENYTSSSHPIIQQNGVNLEQFEDSLDNSNEDTSNSEIHCVGDSDWDIDSDDTVVIPFNQSPILDSQLNGETENAQSSTETNVPVANDPIQQNNNEDGWNCQPNIKEDCSSGTVASAKLEVQKQSLQESPITVRSEAHEHHVKYLKEKYKLKECSIFLHRYIKAPCAKTDKKANEDISPSGKRIIISLNESTRTENIDKYLETNASTDSSISNINLDGTPTASSTTNHSSVRTATINECKPTPAHSNKIPISGVTGLADETRRNGYNKEFVAQKLKEKIRLFKQNQASSSNISSSQVHEDGSLNALHNHKTESKINVQNQAGHSSSPQMTDTDEQSQRNDIEQLKKQKSPDGATTKQSLNAARSDEVIVKRPSSDAESGQTSSSDTFPSSSSHNKEERKKSPVMHSKLAPLNSGSESKKRPINESPASSKKTKMENPPKKKLTQKQYIEMMQNEMDKEAPDLAILREALEQTFNSRKKFSEKATTEARDVMNRYPGLKQFEMVKEEYGRIIEHDVTKIKEIERKLEPYFINVLNPKKKSPPIGIKRHEIWEETLQYYSANENCDETKRRVLGMVAYAFTFAEDAVVDELCYVAGEDEDLSQLDETKFVTPRVVLRKSQLFETDTEMVIYVEGDHFLEVPNFYEAVLCIYSLYYLFNLVYAKKLENMFFYFDYLGGIDQPKFP